MSGFGDLIPEAMPYMAVENLSGTAGSSWEWEYVLEDNDGTLVPFTGITGAAAVRAVMGATPDLVPVVTFPSDGVVRCTATPAASLIAAGNYFHEVEIIRTSDGGKVTLVGGGDSRFTVKPGD